jgi:type I restriction enzyme S subunit
MLATWLPNIPDHWDVVPFTSCARITEGQVQPSDATYRAWPLIAPNHVESGTGKLLKVETAEEQAAISGKYLVRAGDIVYSKIRPALNKVCVASNDCLCSADMYPIRVNARISSRYLFYLMLSAPFAHYMTAESMRVAMPKVNRETFTALRIPLPPIDEQQLIAEILDNETAEADALVARYERLIELLEEKRVALITQAVTKGLNPDAPMKDSGIEWIGTMPLNWEILPFRFCGNISEGQINPGDAAFRDTILIAPNHIESGTGRLLYAETAAEQGAMSGKYRVKRGDVIYSKIRPALNKATIAQTDCLCSADMYPIRASSKVRSAFLLYSMLSKPFVSLTTEVSMRVAMPKVNRETLAAIPMALPPLSMQDKIVSYLDAQLLKIDRTSSEVGRAVALVKEHRSALVTAAVIGQIDVHSYRSKRQPVEIGV